MNNYKEWNEFLENLFDSSLKEYRTAKEYEFLKKKREQLDARLFEAYPEDKNPLIYSLLFETGLDAERGSEYMYRKGLKDCIFILKELGVLA